MGDYRRAAAMRRVFPSARQSLPMNFSLGMGIISSNYTSRALTAPCHPHRYYRTLTVRIRILLWLNPQSFSICPRHLITAQLLGTFNTALHVADGLDLAEIGANLDQCQRNFRRHA